MTGAGAGVHARRLAAVLCALVAAGAHGAPARADPNPIGVHSMLQLNSPYSFMQTMFARAAAMHASALRLDVAPAFVFAGPGRAPDYSGLDQVLALAREYRLRVIGDLLTIPWWIADCQGPTDISAMDRCGTDDLTDYRSMIAEIVGRASPVIRDWEVWNEPDTAAFFSGTPSQYAQMLRAAHDAVKQVDPSANVLLGGVSGPSAMDWLSQVFAVPGADAAHAFDIANVHERAPLDALGGDIGAWKTFFAGNGFTGPLWVTEHGYPSDSAYQFDPSFHSGASSQSAYLAASIPSLLDAGAGMVFVTERDNLGGQFASEGLLGGNVSDPPSADPQAVDKPAFETVAAMAGCYAQLGRDCPSLPPAATAPVIPPARRGSSSTGSMSISDPGPEPLALGSLTLAGTAGASSFTVPRDDCSRRLLEPDESCAITLRFRPPRLGAAGVMLQLPSDNGTLTVPVTAVAPSVSRLTSPQLPTPRFNPGPGGDGVGHTQRLVLQLTNPLAAPVEVARTRLSGPDVTRFRIVGSGCAPVALEPRRHCRVAVRFTPARPGRARAKLTLAGDGAPLVVALRPFAGPRRPSG